MKKIFNLLKNPKYRRIFLVIIMLLTLSGIYIYYEYATSRVIINNSTVQAPVINISPSNSGKVLDVYVKEGQHVTVGDELATVGSETLRADTDGIIITASNLTGSSVTSQTQLIQMINPVYLRVEATIDEDKGLNKIKVGQVVSFTVDALPGDTYWGYVDQVAPSAKSSGFTFSTSTERVTKQFVVYAKFDTVAFPSIKNGMSAKMTVYTKTK